MTKLLVGFVILRSVVLMTASNPGDVRRYHDVSEKAAQGLVPYRDFAFEYPPLAFAYVALPGLLASGTEFPQYHRMFRIQSYFVDLATFLLLLKSRAVPRHLLWAYVVSTTLLGPLLFDRLDIALALLLTAAMLLRMKDRISWSYGCLGLAASFKVFGALCLPVFLALDVSRRNRSAPRYLVAFALGAVLPFLPLALYAGTSVFDFVSYHVERGVQIESMWATLEIILAPLFGMTPEVYWAAGCHNVRTELSPLFANASFVLVLAVASAPLILQRFARQRSPWIPLAATLCGILVVSKVLSPQFLIFLLPVLTVAGVRLQQSRTWAGLLIALAALTTVGYPFLYDDLLALRWHAWAVVGARNVLLLVATGWLYWRWMAGPETEDTSTRADSAVRRVD